MELSTLSICFIVFAVVGIMLALAAAQPRPEYLQRQEAVRADQRAFAAQYRQQQHAEAEYRETAYAKIDASRRSRHHVAAA